MQQIEKWGLFEIALNGKRDGNPFLDYEVAGSFRSEQERVRTRGFYDGGGVYRVRFMPSFEGRYAYTIAGSAVDALGPLGRPYTLPAPDVLPVAVAGGYGAAAMFMLTREQPGVLLMGARSAADVILTERYRDAGYDVRVATNDGSVGTRGFVTELIKPLLEENPAGRFFFYGCGPHPMLMALAKLMKERGLAGELSLDQIMCCGVGACFGCVVKVNDPGSPDGWRYARSCKEGPVFPLADIYVE